MREDYLPGVMQQGADEHEPCPRCGAQSAEPGYGGHAMHCLGFYGAGRPGGPGTR